MTKFKVGDKVRMKPGIVVGKSYDGIELLPSMPFFGTKEVRRVDMFPPVTVRVAGCNYCYSVEMLEKVRENKEESKMEFKVGNKVKLTKEPGHVFKTGRCGIGFDEVGTVKNVHTYSIDVLFPSFADGKATWSGNAEDLVPVAEFQVGDVVRIRCGCTLEEVYENGGHGCLNETAELIGRFLPDVGHEFVVEDVDSDGDVYIESQWINFKIFELVKRSEPVKEMTLAEVCKELGYDVKIVKEEN